jgi:hypothetical protein
VKSDSSNIPKQSQSYAAATKKSLSERVIRFKIGSIYLDPQDTVFGALHKSHLQEKGLANATMSPEFFKAFHEITYFTSTEVKFEKSLRQNSSQTHFSSDSENLNITPDSNSLSGAHTRKTFTPLGGQKIEFCQTAPLAALIKLVHVLHMINENWEEIYDPVLILYMFQNLLYY